MILRVAKLSFGRTRERAAAPGVEEEPALKFAPRRAGEAPLLLFPVEHSLSPDGQPPTELEPLVVLVPLVVSDDWKPNPTLVLYFLEADRGAGLSSARLNSIPLHATTDEDPAVTAMLLGVVRLLAFATESTGTGGLVEIRRHGFRLTAGGDCLVSTGRAAWVMRGTGAGTGAGAGGDSAVGNDMMALRGRGLGVL